MTKKTVTPVLSRRNTDRRVALSPKPKADTSKLRLGFIALLLAGIVTLILFSSLTSGFFRRLSSIVSPAPTSLPVTTLTIQRGAKYAGLDFTLLNAQIAASFPDDPIHAGASTVRLNLSVTNATTGQGNVLYYDAVRLLIPKLAPVAPANLSLAAALAPGAKEAGWIDFAVSQPVQLAALKLQLGSMSQNESLVTIPFTGSFNPASYQDRTVKQSLTINYYFPYYQPHLLVYHLTAVDVRYDYRGGQAKARQQFYVLYFLVDNPNSFNVSPGFGFDYVRLIVGGSQISPVDNSLPFGFNGNARHVSGHVTFSAPAGMHSLTIDFLVQYGSGGSYFYVRL